MRPGLLVVTLCLLFPRTAIADDTRLVPDQVRAGEVTLLIIEADYRIATLPSLDSSPLQRDFRVLDIASRVTRMQPANGEIYHRAQWRIQITPKRIGRLEVPGLAIGDRMSKPLTLDVEAVTALEARHQLFIEVDAQPTEPYVNQEIRVVTRIFHSSEFDEARLSVPRVVNAASYQHGGDRRYAVERFGRQYQVLERSQSLFPRHSGELLLDGAEFRGRIGNGNGFDERWLHRQGESMRLKVRERPATFRGSHWIPARHIEVKMSWAQPPQQLQIGESAEFTLTLVAEGLAAEFLPPNLLLSSGDGLQVFADLEQRKDLLSGDALIGRLEQRYAVVASRAGEMILPGLALDWWDTATDTARQARLPPTSLTVADPAAMPAESPQPSTAWPAWINRILLAGGGLLLALVGLLMSASRRRAIGRWLARRRLRSRLQRACRAGNALAARATLSEWCQTRDLTMMSSELRRAVRDLDNALYAPTPMDWQGDLLWRSLSGAARDADRPAPGLPELYPAPGARH